VTARVVTPIVLAALASALALTVASSGAALVAAASVALLAAVVVAVVSGHLGPAAFGVAVLAAAHCATSAGEEASTARLSATALLGLLLLLTVEAVDRSLAPDAVDDDAAATDRRWLTGAAALGGAGALLVGTVASTATRAAPLLLGLASAGALAWWIRTQVRDALRRGEIEDEELPV
jgi:hypothetical protein